MNALLVILATIAGYALARKLTSSSSTGSMPMTPMTILPTPDPNDWHGWVWPVPITGSRAPVITQEWKPGRDPPPGQASGATSNHLGVDIMFRKLASDPVGKVKHTATPNFIAPDGTRIIAAGPGKIWATYASSFYGFGILIDHGTVNEHVGGVNTFYQHLGSFEQAWKKGDVIKAGDVLGTMGFAPGDPEGLRHLHFELRFPREGVTQDDWRIDPAPYMAFWKRVTLPEALPEVPDTERGIV